MNAPGTLTPRPQHSISWRVTASARIRGRAVACCSHSEVSKRDALLAASSVALATAGLVQPPSSAAADDFNTTPSGLKILEVKKGSGPVVGPGDRVTVHWAGYTTGYQGKRIDNTSVRDEPYEFTVGARQAIAAFDEAVTGMQPGGIRRVEIRGEIPELSYPRDRSQRFTNEPAPGETSAGLFKYRYGPQPSELGGQRALDFVLDNPTLQPFNRTLLFDIKLLTVRKPRG